MYKQYKGWCMSIILNILNSIAPIDITLTSLHPYFTKAHHFHATPTTSSINFQNICGNIRATPVWWRIPFHFECLSMNTTLDSRPWRCGRTVRKCAVTDFVRPMRGTFLIVSTQLKKIIKSVSINKPKLIHLYIYIYISLYPDIFYIFGSTRHLWSSDSSMPIDFSCSRNK